MTNKIEEKTSKRNDEKQNTYNEICHTQHAATVEMGSMNWMKTGRIIKNANSQVYFVCLCNVLVAKEKTETKKNINRKNWKSDEIMERIKNKIHNRNCLDFYMKKKKKTRKERKS